MWDFDYFTGILIILNYKIIEHLCCPNCTSPNTCTLGSVWSQGKSKKSIQDNARPQLLKIQLFLLEFPAMRQRPREKSGKKTWIYKYLSFFFYIEIKSVVCYLNYQRHTCRHNPYKSFPMSPLIFNFSHIYYLNLICFAPSIHHSSAPQYTPQRGFT